MKIQMKSVLLKSLVTLTVMGGGYVAQAQNMPIVDVTAITQHPALDSIRDGIKDALTKAGYVDGKNMQWNYQNAQGNASIAVQIARTFVGQNPTVIVPITTPSAQAVVSVTKTIPVVYAGVTDPIAARLVKSWSPSGTNVTGVSNKMPLDKQLDLIKEIVPKVKTVGMVYDPGEENSVVVVKELKALAPKVGIQLIVVAAPRTVDVQSAARSLVGKVDAFYTSTDNNVVAAFESMVKVANDAKIPLIASDTDSVKRGAIAALGLNYFRLGQQAGEKVVQIIKGEKPGAIASDISKNFELYLNKKAATAQGVILPESALKRATKIID